MVKKNTSERGFVFFGRSRLQGFTLIEILITISLAAIVGAGIYSLLDSGIRVADRVANPIREEDLNIFFEKFSRDIQNTFKYSEIPFSGDEEQLSFATTIQAGEELGMERGIGRVRYFYDSGDDSIERAEENLSDLFEEDENRSRSVLGGVTSASFMYYQYTPIDNVYQWITEWEAGDENQIPIAVQIRLKYNDEENEKYTTRTFSIPVGGQQLEG